MKNETKKMSFLQKANIVPIFTIAFIFLLASCSSVPKRPAEVFSIQSMADTLIGQANKEADQANYAEAEIILNEALRLAVTTDRPALRIRVKLALANVQYSLGRTAEAEKIWREAENEAKFGQEQLLASACRIYRARSLLLAGRVDPEETLALVHAEQGNLKQDKQLLAVSWTVKGMAEKELGRYAEAERSVNNALAIHTKENYLEQAGYDWYLIASIRSVSGNYRGANQALNRALHYDRRAENTFGLAMDWAAMGDVYRKLENENSAARSYRRSAEIFRAMDKHDHAREVESRIKQSGEQENVARTKS